MFIVVRRDGLDIRALQLSPQDVASRWLINFFPCYAYGRALGGAHRRGAAPTS
jgi:hypothetical protein